MYKFEIGDRVMIKKDFVANSLSGKCATVVGRKNDWGLVYEIKLDEPWGYLKTVNFFFYEAYLDYINPSSEKEKEELRLSHIEIDPFGEEIWYV